MAIYNSIAEYASSVGAFSGSLGATDNAVLRADGTGGAAMQGSIIQIDDSGNIVPATTDTGALGTTVLMWSDTYLASGGVINWDNGDVTVTHAANTLAFAGAATGYTFADGPVVPATNDGAALGTTALQWSDVFVALGGVINFDNGDVSITHSANTLAFAGAASGYLFNGGPLRPVANDGAALGTPPISWSDLFLASGGVINFANGNVIVTHAAATLSFTGASTGGYNFDNPVFLTERAAALGDTAGLGQLWVRSDTPNLLMFTDDAGTDQIVGKKAIVEAKTATYPVTVEDAGKTFTNEGAGASVQFDLPSAAAGLGPYKFIVQNANLLTIVAATGDSIQIGTSVTSTSRTMTPGAVGDTVTIEAVNATEWFATAWGGTWTGS